MDKKNRTILREALRFIPDYPKKGVNFCDITTLLSDKDAFSLMIEEMARPFIGKNIDKVIGVEARGFIIAAALAYRLGCGFIPIRKKGKLPHQTVRIAYSLEYGVDEMEVHCDAINAKERVLLVDDILATGGTAEAATKLLQELGAVIVSVVFLAHLTFLPGAQKLKKLGVDFYSLLEFDTP